MQIRKNYFEKAVVLKDIMEHETTFKLTVTVLT